MAYKKKLNNIESIIEVLKKESSTILKIIKFDGITAECTVPAGETCSKAIDEITTICQKLKLLPIDTHIHNYNKNLFVIEFPELEPIYTDKQVEKMYKANFKWLLDNLLNNDTTNAIDKSTLVANREVFVKQAITTYCVSNINSYKQSKENLLNNKDYRDKVGTIYLLYLDEYLLNKYKK